MLDLGGAGVLRLMRTVNGYFREFRYGPPQFFCRC